MEKRQVSSINGTGKIKQPYAEDSNDYFLIPHTKINSKLDERPQCETGIHENPKEEHRY